MDLVEIAAKIQTVLHLQYHTNNALKRGVLKRSRFESARLLLSPNSGYFLPVLYFMVKVLNLAIAVAVLFILQVRKSFLWLSYWFWIADADSFSSM